MEPSILHSSGEWLEGPQEILLWGYRITFLAPLIRFSSYGDDSLYKAFQAFLPMNPVIQLIRIERLEPLILDDEILLETNVRLDILVSAIGLVRLEKSHPLSQEMAGIARGLNAEFYLNPSENSAVMSLLDGSFGILIGFVLQSEILQIETFVPALRATVRIGGQESVDS